MGLFSIKAVNPKHSFSNAHGHNHFRPDEIRLMVAHDNPYDAIHFSATEFHWDSMNRQTLRFLIRIIYEYWTRTRLTLSNCILSNHWIPLYQYQLKSILPHNN
jgi:hypothetical protein